MVGISSTSKIAALSPSGNGFFLSWSFEQNFRQNFSTSRVADEVVYLEELLIANDLVH